MQRYQILNIQEVLDSKQGTSYKGSIAVFLSAKGENFHLLDDYPFYINAFSYALITAGEAILSVDGTDYPIDSHSICIISPLHLTRFRPLTTDFQAIFLSVSKAFIDAIAILNIQHRIVRGMRMHSHPVLSLSEEEKQILCQCTEDIKSQIQRTEHHYQLSLMQNALGRFYLELDNILDNQQQESISEGTQPRYATLVRDFITLLMLNFKSEHTVLFYAGKLNITPQYLTTIIKQQTGRTVYDFIYEMLYSEARNLLSLSELSIQQIAFELHFSDPSAFTKFFRKKAGCAPLTFRKNGGRK